jgi:N-acetylglutamate synthase
MEAASPADVAALEELAHRTWPCRMGDALGDWILREADGFTRRANSCLALGDPGLSLPDSIDRVEAWYRERDLEPCIKICPTSPSGLDSLLESRDWSVATPSLALRRDIGQNLSTSSSELSVSAIPDAGWLRTVSLWDGENPERARRHRELAQRIQSAGFLRWTAGEGILAVGLVSMDGSNSYLYDVVVHPERRGRGIGRAFCSAALDWARSCSIRTMALQVLESNTAARALYASLGFAEHHRYHYRVAPCTRPSCGG